MVKNYCCNLLTIWYQNKVNSQIQEAELQKIITELENTVGFIDNIENKKEEIENRLRSVIEKDNHGIKKILSECEELNTKYFNNNIRKSP